MSAHTENLVAPAPAGRVEESPAKRVQQDRLLPLTGVRVLDLGQLFNGPYASFLMAMAGADVIKIEPVTGDKTRRRSRDGDYPFRALNGSKRGIVLDLKSASGKRVFLDLVRKADVVSENFAPSVMPRLGLGPDVLLKVNPRLIYATGSGFGRTGPYRDKRALDLNIQAMSGVMSTTGEMGGRPLKAGVPMADIMTGTHVYGAIVSALFERERTGLGRVVEVSMLESLFATLLPAVGHVYESNSVPKRTGNRHVADSYVPFDTFETKDGWIAVVCATDDHWEKLTGAMGRPDLGSDAELRTLPGRVARIEEVTQAITHWTKQHTRSEAEALCQQYHVPAAPLRDVKEVLADEHLRERGFLTERQTEAGTIVLPNSPIRYEGSPMRALADAPGLGQHTEEVLAELCGFGKDELESLRREGAFGK